MEWANIAILSAAVMGGVNILDSHLLSKRMPGLRAFLLPVAIIHLIYGIILFILFPLPAGVGIQPVLIAIASSALRTGAVLIMLNSLKKEEVSRVIPIVYSYPIFVAIMAVPLLGESLNSLNWLAIIIVVLGAVTVSIRQNPFSSTSWYSKLLLLFGSSLLFATADVASKYALGYISSWNMFWLTTFCMSGIFLSISVRPKIIRQLMDMKQRKSTMGLLTFNETLAPLGIVLSFWALERGPVSLVSAIISSRPMFVLIFAIILSRLSPTFLEWHSGNRILVLRIAGTVMVIGGITIIYLL